MDQRIQLDIQRRAMELRESIQNGEISLLDVFQKRYPEDVFDEILGINTRRIKKEEINRPDNFYCDAVEYIPILYRYVAKILRQIPQESRFADVGAGAGLITNVLSTFPDFYIEHVEYDSLLINRAQQNYENNRLKQSAVVFKEMDAIHWRPDNVDVVILYFPFKLKTMEHFLDNLVDYLKVNPRSLKLICILCGSELNHNPKYSSVFKMKEILIPFDSFHLGFETCLYEANPSAI